MTLEEAKALQAAAYRAGVYRAGIGKAKDGGHTLIITLGATSPGNMPKARCFSRKDSAKAYLFGTGD